MSNNLPEKYKNNIFYKIRSFIRNIFVKQQQVETEEIYNDKTDGSVNVKVDSVVSVFGNEKSKTKTKEEIFNIIDSNPDVLEKLPTERLYELTKMYDEKILENDRQIKHLKSKLKTS